MTIFGRKDLGQVDWAEQERLRIEEAARARRPYVESIEVAPREDRPSRIARIVGRIGRAIGRPDRPR